MKQVFQQFLALLFLQQISMAQPLQTARPFYVGHSLVNLHIPAMVHSLAVSAGKSTGYDYQIGIGANLWYQWDTLIGNEQGLPW